MSKKRVYLAGSITGLTEDEANSWRDYFASNLYDEGFEVINPYEKMKRFYSYGSGPNIEKVAMDHDLAHVKTSDVVIVKLDNNKSLGTMAELAVAYDNHIPIIGVGIDVIAEGQHPWVKNMVSVYFASMEDVVSYLCDFY